jgi:hypothetical protein
MGCIVTFSGDAAFLQRLIDGLLTEESVASKIPLYIDYHDSFLSTQVDETTGQRHDLQVPFTDTCRPQSLVYYDTPKTICPDPVHMTIRCVEHDLRKMANKILKMKAPYGEEALRHLEMNLTERDIKPPSFEFIKERGRDDVISKICAVSLSGVEALLVIADPEELEGTEREISPLYSNVWSTDEICIESTSRPGDVLRDIGFADLFTIQRDNTEKSLMSMNAAAELLRRSLNECVRLLRHSRYGYVFLIFLKIFLYLSGIFLNN